MSLRRQIDSIDDALDDLREVVHRNVPRSIEIPFSIFQDNDPDQMKLIQGQWTLLDHWPGMRCMLTKTDDDTHSRYILCEVSREMDLGSHKHDGFVEEIFMMEGQMRDLIHGVTLRAGHRQKYPAGEAHCPVFDGPALFMVVFRKVG